MQATFIAADSRSPRMSPNHFEVGGPIQPEGKGRMQKEADISRERPGLVYLASRADSSSFR